MAVDSIWSLTSEIMSEEYRPQISRNSLNKAALIRVLLRSFDSSRLMSIGRFFRNVDIYGRVGSDPARRLLLLHPHPSSHEVTPRRRPLLGRFDHKFPPHPKTAGVRLQSPTVLILPPFGPGTMEFQ